MAQIYTADLVYRDGAFRRGEGVLVEGGSIAEVGPADDLTQRHADAERIDWSGMVMIPGLVNSHNHSFQSLLRGVVVDQPFLVWRDRSLYRYTPYLDEEAIYAGALLSFGEMLRYGVTTVADFFYVHDHGTGNDEAVIRAARDVGIRLVFARAMYNWSGAPAAYQETIPESVERTRRLAARYQGDPLVTVCPAPHSLHGASPEMIQAGHTLAGELGTKFHIHVAEERYQVEKTLEEHGTRQIQFLNQLGVVDDSLLAVHLCWLSGEEIRLLGERAAGLAYCPSSNMFLADGVTDLPGLLAAGVTGSLGTDGLCSNNRASIIEEMRMASLLQKVHTLDAAAVTAEQVFAMATSGGGKALGIPVGRIEPGYAADLVGISLGDLSMQPAPVPESALLAQIVYALQPPGIRRVVVGGREVARDLELTAIPSAEIARRVENVVSGWPRPNERMEQ
ncbi:MAG TPA: amidohydrolase [Chloroflexota bacterium]|nr:amidohydrolase [Chloroflexota bacterium]